jgi:hypothetical protein
MPVGVSMLSIPYEDGVRAFQKTKGYRWVAQSVARCRYERRHKKSDKTKARHKEQTMMKENAKKKKKQEPMPNRHAETTIVGLMHPSV